MDRHGLDDTLRAAQKMRDGVAVDADFKKRSPIFQQFRDLPPQSAALLADLAPLLVRHGKTPPQFMREHRRNKLVFDARGAEVHQLAVLHARHKEIVQGLGVVRGNNRLLHLRLQHQTAIEKQVYLEFFAE